MFLYKISVVLLLCNLLEIFGGKLLREKRADIELQTCLDNFNIHKDKIIRTQDSQNMGAKYLNEIDLGSREECLRLCCETDNCDVFVFEEKNAGSCYLFHCGPPEDFKCKFTHHVNYSSGVLAINRHLPDLESQIKLTKHEQDLNKLKKPEEAPSTPKAPKQEVRTTSTTTPVPITRPHQQEDVRRCSPFQFECRSTGECIGIYNACDGIPQCADGSDEAVELGCPGSATTVPPTKPPVPEKIPQPAFRPEDFLRPPLYNAGPVQGWLPRQPNYAIDKNSHIFNHKENGLQVAEEPELSNGPGLPPQYYDNSYRFLTNDNTNRFIDKTVQEEINKKSDQMQYNSMVEPAANPKHVQDKMAHDLKHSKYNMPHEKTIKIEQHTLIHRDQFADVMAYKMQDSMDQQDGVSQTPKGAILSLTLGLIITGIMAVLIGCRLKVVRRKMRRGGKSYAHDADYLVNGMYL